MDCRFETNAMDYRGSTVCIFKLTDGDIRVIAADQEWRYNGCNWIQWDM